MLKGGTNLLCCFFFKLWGKGAEWKPSFKQKVLHQVEQKTLFARNSALTTEKPGQTRCLLSLHLLTPGTGLGVWGAHWSPAFAHLGSQAGLPM